MKPFYRYLWEQVSVVLFHCLKFLGIFLAIVLLSRAFVSFPLGLVLLNVIVYCFAVILLLVIIAAGIAIRDFNKFKD